MATFKRKKRHRPFDRDFKSIHYSCVYRGIEPHVGTAWLLELPDGEQRILLWHDKATIEDVHSLCKREHPGGFKLGMVDTGEFVLQRTENSYRSDARSVDQDWYVTATFANLPDPWEGN